MGAWHATYANLLRSRFGALVAYASLLEDDPVAARALAEDATVAVFSARRSPRGTFEAEVACREWMATHAADATRAAAVLMAIDALDADGVRRVLRKATPNPLPVVAPEAVAAMRERFVAGAGVYAVPTGGVNALLGPARRSHQGARLRGVAVVAAAAVAVGAAGYVGLPYLPLGTASADASTASASPSPTTVRVTWAPGPERTAALAGFHFPECGEEFAPEPQAVGGVTPKPRAEVFTDADFGDTVMLSAGFVTPAEGATWLLADPNAFVVTLDDVVVYTSKEYESGLEAFLANAPASQGGMGFGRSNLCDAREASRAFEKDLGEFDWATATAEEQEEWDAAWKEFYAKWDTFEPGLYKVYQVSPMVFGEQAALAQVFKEQDGVDQVAHLATDIAYSKLAQDPRVAPYCTGSMEVGDIACDVPADELREVLTREIDPATINQTAASVGISEPIEYDWSE